MIDWQGIVIHHSAGTDTPLADRDSIRRWHIEGEGWLDVGYHYLVEIVGRQYMALKGRPETMQGSHALGRNRTHLGVCLVGDFSVSPPPIAQLAMASELCAELCERYCMPPTAIEAHRDGYATECPGRAFSVPLLDYLRGDVSRRLAPAA